MAQWSNDDSSGNSVTWATALVNLPANSVNQAALYGNTTAEAFNNAGVGIKQAIGQFGLDTTEISVSNAAIAEIVITNPGSGYLANAVVTLSGNATANAEANSSGKISLINITDDGSGYTSSPSVSIAAPGAQTFNANASLFISQTFNANAGVNETTDFISITTCEFVNNDVVTYTVAAGNTAVDPLTNATAYYVVAANSSGVKLANTSNGTPLELTKGVTETGHTLTRSTGGFIEIGSNKYQVNDLVTYTVAAGNTVITGLANGSQYYVVAANSSGIKLSNVAGGSAISLTPGITETGHSLTGETATAQAVLTGLGASFGCHAGWVIRRRGTGGRAGRVQYETLVAMGSMTGDGSDDAILKDS